MDSCVFCKIIRGELPSAKVWEDKNFLAFLSIAPHTPGHTLVIPKKHVDYLFDLEDQDLASLVVACEPIAKALKKVFHPATGKVGLAVMGMGVPHVHVHLVPMGNEKDLDTGSAKHNVPFEEIQKNAERIRLVLKN